MHVPVSLHTHEQQASADSSTPHEQLLVEYARQGTGLVGFVGHDARPVVDSTTNRAITGIEHELRKQPTRLHVVEYPDHDFSFLAHPKLTWPEDTRRQALTAAEDLGVDAVEKYNRGVEQYPGRLPFPEVANDDAHNTAQCMASHMTVDVDDPTPETIIAAIKNGEARLHNDGLSRTEKAAGKINQATSLLNDGSWREHLFR